MLTICVRDMPHLERAVLVWSRGWTAISLPSILTRTSSFTTNFSSPLGPFAVTVWPLTVAVTPCGSETGFFPIRDILLSSSLLLFQVSVFGDDPDDRIPIFPITRQIRRSGRG